MESQRIDLGPGRWMAAGGEAFLYIRVKQGQSIGIIVAPVRDVVVERSVVFEKPGWAVFGLVTALPSMTGFIWYMFEGSFNNLWGWLALVVIAALYLFIAIQLYRRRGRYALLYDFGSFEGPRRIDFNDAQAGQREFTRFVEHLEILSKAASKNRRGIHHYSLYSWWFTSIWVIAAIALFTGLVPWFWEEADTSHALAFSLVLTAILFACSSERYLFIHFDLRRAQSQLLDNQPDAAIKTLKRFLRLKPDHPYATKLMTTAELLRGNMREAEEVIIQDDSLDPNRPSWLMRALYYKHWESRHGDH